MNKINLFSAFCLLFFASMGYSEIEGNPDRFPSVCLSVQRGNYGIDGQFPAYQTIKYDSGTMENNIYDLDIRYPINDFFTLGVGFGHYNAHESFGCLRENANTSGTFGRLAIRYYMK
jgi:hypothetical protein